MISLTRWGSVALVALAMAGCGGDGGSDAPVTPPAASVKEQINSAAAVPANDTSVNPAAPFTVLQGAGVPAVTINGAPKVNFAIFSDGKVKEGLKVTVVSAIIAKLIPGTNGNPDEWRSYTHRTRTAATPVAGVVYSDWLLATLNNPVYASRTNAGVDPKQTDAALLAAQLVYNSDGYYTYNFSTNITDPSKTNGVTFEPGLTHRVAIQVTYTNAAGETIAANPYFDFTVDGSGKSIAVTDPSKTRKMTDVASCNGCHEKLTAHGSRIDTQYCVTCHNPNSVDANSGNSLNLATMVHKIHSAKLLASQVATGGEYVTIRSHDYAEVGFPQDLRNCAKCHSGSNPATPQGDNWKKVVSKEACLTCHANKTGSAWDTSHQVFARDPAVNPPANPTAKAKDLTNAQCAKCHVGAISSERVHWNQNEENAAKYKMNIEDVTYTPSATTGGTSTVTVKYFLSDPTNNNAAYNLTASDNGTPCASPTSCSSSTKFGNLRFVLAYQNMVGQYQPVTEFSSYNNGGGSANAYAYLGTNNGSNHYTVNITVPANTTYTAAFGTARVVSYGQIKEAKLQAKSAADPRPPVVPTTLINTLVQHAYKDVALTGNLQPRRAIVSNEKCNVCHGALGATSGSNIPALQNAFHSGARNTVEACVVCHDPNRASSTVMTNGLVLNESFQFKRMIHGIHGNAKRLYPFTHGNAVVGAFCNPANPLSKSPLCDPNLVLVAGDNYGAEVAYPQVGLNCDSCHVNGSWKQDLGTLGAMTVAVPGSVTDLTKSTTFSATAALFESSGACVGATGSVAAKTLKCSAVDLNKIPVISPKAASCTACHDSSKSIAHVTSFGGSAFGDKNQSQIAGLPRETCNDCHSPGGFKGVDIVHGQK